MTLPENKNNITAMLKKKENAFAIIIFLMFVGAFVFVTVHMANSWSDLGNYDAFMKAIRSEIPENETFIANIKEYLFFENNYIPLGMLTYSDNKTACELLTTRKPGYFVAHNLEYSAVIQEQENTIPLIRNCGGKISLIENVNCNCLDGGFKIYSIKWNV